MADQKIIVDGRHFPPGHPLAWRRGLLLSPPKGGGFSKVRLERRGRERKNKELPIYGGWLIIETPEVLAKLAKAGLLDGRDDA